MCGWCARPRVEQVGGLDACQLGANAMRRRCGLGGSRGGAGGRDARSGCGDLGAPLAAGLGCHVSPRPSEAGFADGQALGAVSRYLAAGPGAEARPDAERPGGRGLPQARCPGGAECRYRETRRGGWDGQTGPGPRGAPPAAPQVPLLGTDGRF